MKTAAITTLFIITIIAYMGIAGEMDYQDAVKAEEIYCQQVAEGLPDYKGVGCE